MKTYKLFKRRFSLIFLLGTVGTSLILSACGPNSVEAQSKTEFSFSTDNSASLSGVPSEYQTTTTAAAQYQINYPARTILSNSFMKPQAEFPKYPTSTATDKTTQILLYRDNYKSGTLTNKHEFDNNLEAGLKSFYNDIFGSSMPSVAVLNKLINDYNSANQVVGGASSGNNANNPYQQISAQAQDQSLNLTLVPAGQNPSDFIQGHSGSSGLPFLKNKYTWLGQVDKNLFPTSDLDSNIVPISTENPARTTVDFEGSKEQLTAKYNELYNNLASQDYIGKQKTRIVVLPPSAADSLNEYLPQIETWNKIMQSDFDPWSKTGSAVVLVGAPSASRRVSSLLFREDQLGFLMGFSTAYALNYGNNSSIFNLGLTRDTSALNVGMITNSMSVSAISSLSGYEQGILFFNKNMAGKRVTDDSNASKPYTLQPINLVFPENPTDTFATTPAKIASVANELVTKKKTGFIFTNFGYGGTVNEYNSLLETLQKLGQPVAIGSAHPVDLTALAKAHNPSNTLQNNNNPWLQIPGSNAMQTGPTTYSTNIFRFNGVRNLGYSLKQTLRAIALNYYGNSRDASFEGYKAFGYLNVAGADNNGISLNNQGLTWLLRGVKGLIQVKDSTYTNLKDVNFVVNRDPHLYLATGNPRNANSINSYDLMKYLGGGLNNIEPRLVLNETWNSLGTNFKVTAPNTVKYGLPPELSILSYLLEQNSKKNPASSGTGTPNPATAPAAPAPAPVAPVAAAPTSAAPAATRRK